MSSDYTTPSAPSAPSTPSTPSTPSAPSAPTAAPTSYGAPIQRGPRIGTIVWGALVTLFGVLVMAISARRGIDLELAFIVTLVAAGTALLIGAVIAALRGRRKEPRPGTLGP